MSPAAFESVWRIELPAAPQELQVKPFTLKHYNTLKQREKEIAAASKVQRKAAASSPARHCHCCTWKRRVELEVAAGRAGGWDMCTSSPTEIVDKLADNFMVDATVHSSAGSGTPSISGTSAPVVPAGKYVSNGNARAAQQPEPRRVRLTLKVKRSNPVKTPGVRPKTKRPQAKERDRGPVAALPVKTSSRGRVQRPLQRHRNDLY